MFQVRTGVDYLVASKIKDTRPKETVVYFAKMLDSTGEVVKWKHGYEGVDLCRGLGQALFRENANTTEGDVLIRLPGRALDWIRDRNRNICRHQFLNPPRLQRQILFDGVLVALQSRVGLPEPAQRTN